MRRQEHDRIVKDIRAAHQQKVAEVSARLGAVMRSRDAIANERDWLHNRYVECLNILGDLQARGVIDLPKEFFTTTHQEEEHNGASD